MEQGFWYVICPECGKRVPVTQGAWVSTHFEPESSAVCNGSGIYIDERTR